MLCLGRADISVTPKNAGQSRDSSRLPVCPPAPCSAPNRCGCGHGTKQQVGRDGAAAGSEAQPFLSILPTVSFFLFCFFLSFLAQLFLRHPAPGRGNNRAGRDGLVGPTVPTRPWPPTHPPTHPMSPPGSERVGASWLVAGVSRLGGHEPHQRASERQLANGTPNTTNGASPLFSCGLIFFLFLNCGAFLGPSKVGTPGTGPGAATSAAAPAHVPHYYYCRVQTS